MSTCNCGCPSCQAAAGRGADTEMSWRERKRARHASLSPRIRYSVSIPGGDAGLEFESPGPSPAPTGCSPAEVLGGFERGSYRLLPAHLDALTKLVIRLRDNRPAAGSIARVRGHTDTTGGAGANAGLAYARALEVRAFLEQAFARVNLPLQLHTTGASSDEPAAPNTTEANRGRNRRVEIRVCVGAGNTGAPPSAPAAPGDSPAAPSDDAPSPAAPDATAEPPSVADTGAVPAVTLIPPKMPDLRLRKPKTLPGIAPWPRRFTVRQKPAPRRRPVRYIVRPRGRR